MGKKPVVVQDGKKKKKSGCGTVCLVVLIVIVAILGIGTGVGYVVGNKYTKEYLDMPLSECLGVVGSLYWASDKKMVDNGFDDTDYDKFETEFKHQLFLKDEVELDLTEAAKLLMGGDENEQTPNAVALYRAEADGAEGNAPTDPDTGDSTGAGADPDNTGSGDTTGDTETAGDDKLMEFLKQYITRENIDRDRLAAYNKDNHDDYLFRLQDRQVAAFVDRLLGIALKDNESVKNILEQTGMTEASQAVALRQIKFERVSGTYVNKTTNETKPGEVSMAKVTVQIKLTDVTKAALYTHIPNTFGAWWAQFAARTLLPNNVYVTLGVGLDPTVDVDVELSINRLAGKKMESAYKLIEGIMNIDKKIDPSTDQTTPDNTTDETPTGIKDKLNKSINESLKPMLETLSTVVDFNNIENGAIKIDAYDMVADMIAGDNNDLSGQEVLGTLSNIATSEPVTVDAERDYKNQYTNAQGDVIRVPEGEQVPDGYTKVDYGKNMIDDLSNNEVLKPKEDGTAYTLTEVVNALVNGDETVINKPAAGEDKAKLTLTDNLIATILQEAIDSNINSGDSSMKDIDVGVKQAVITEKEVDGVTHQYVDVCVALNPETILGNMGDAGSMVEAFLPEEMNLTVTLDLTVDMEAENRDGATLRYNSLSVEETEEMLAVFAKMGAEDFNADTLTSEVADAMSDLIDKMSQQVQLELVASK